MEGVILLNASENTNKVEEEEKARFVREILDNIGLPLEGIWDDNGEMSIDGKIKLRSILSSYGMHIIDDMSGGLEIYAKKEKIAIWYRPQYTLKRDYSAIDPKKKLYLEMKIKNWSSFEEE